jgi:arylsulfatase A-like enzyme
MVFPTQLVRSGYNTAGFGKIAHWEIDDRMKWSFDSSENDWYEYQNSEWKYMNASIQPDKVWSEDQFRDSYFAKRTIETFHKLIKLPKYFMLAIGFKLPHLAVHIPYKYYEMYKNDTKKAMWKLTKKELRHPATAPDISYRCCAMPSYDFLNEEGSLPHIRSVQLGNMNMAFTDQMHDELMMGYCGAITFLDKLLGQILDVVDQYALWNNLTVILTADHGMHNGEKGTW